MVPALDISEPFKNLNSSIIKAAIESSRSPLIITDNNLPDNPIIYSNQAFLDLTGYSMKEVIGHNCRFLQGEDTDKSTVRRLRKAVATGEYVRVTLKNYTKKQRPFWNDLVMSPIKDAEGNTTHFIGMQLDITERIEHEHNLMVQTDALARSNKELEQFTYATSHDLQEPLRMISSYLQLIDRRYSDLFDEDGSTFLHFATEGAERMQTLISDLLALSKISMTNENFSTVDMNEALERALFNLRLSIEESGAIVNVMKLPSIYGDIIQMTQLLQNLIGNAIKYRRPDIQPVITIEAHENTDNVEFVIQDNGQGINQKHFTRIFIVFQRLHTHAEYEGTGIGLAICSKIIDRHNGKIWVESKEGSGSSFKFILPKNKEGSS